jgi:rhamnosyltransferase
MNSNDVAAAVVLYWPDSKVLDNLATYQEAVGHVYAIDNSGNAEHISGAVIELLKKPNVTYVSFGRNTGVAHALNTAAQLASKDGFAWLLTMDQDSAFEFGHACRYISLAETESRKGRKVTHFSTSHIFPPAVISGDGGRQELYFAITSGSLIDLGFHNEIGGFWEALFIDEVDHEYCIRSRNHGGRILAFSDVSLLHTVGRRKAVRTLRSGKKLDISLHSAIRYYYITRNVLLLWKRYNASNPVEMQIRMRALRRKLKRLVLYERGRVHKIFAAFLGFLDYLRGRTGKRYRII